MDTHNFSYRTLLMAMSFLMVFSIVGATSAMGQVTNARVSGTVVDENSKALPGANVVMVHRPTGTEYGTVTETDGNFNFGNVRVGGPYVIEVSFVGYRSERETGFQLDLGENRTFEFQLESKTEKLGEVTVEAEEGLFSEDRQGIKTNIDQEAIETAPTMDRQVADFARLTPQAIVGNDDDDGSSISIAGQNNRYNSLFIDGAVANDVFGLSAQGTDGGQTGASPISIDAIEQFDVEVSPYDVTQSYFGGGAINAVTKSGSNEFEGSFTYETRNETVSEDLPEFTNNRYVGNVSGPIIEDELFFFANFDINREESPQPFEGGFDGFQGDAISSSQDLNEFVSFLDQTTGFDPGEIRGQQTTLDSEKFLIRLDWNINQDHKLMTRYSRSNSENVDAFGGSPTNLTFSSQNEIFPNTTHIFATELNSSFGNRFANSLTFSFKRVKDNRGTNINSNFPTVSITDGGADVNFGAEPFSTVNLLKQNVMTATNDFDIYAGDHTITVGTHQEFFDITNKFVPFNNGWHIFFDTNDNGTGIDEFKQTVCASPQVDRSSVDECSKFPNRPAFNVFARGFSLQDDNPNTPGFEETLGDATNAQGAFNSLNSSFYIQDEWKASDRLTLTGGLRVDIPFYLDDPAFPNPNNPLSPDDPKINPKTTTIPAIKSITENGRQFHDLEGARVGETPSPNPHIAPRFGFNVDLQEEYDTQIRGGTGVFTSRQPLVWPGGMYLNNGMNTGTIDFAFGRNEFRPNPGEGSVATRPQFEGRSPSELIPSGRLEIFAEDYKNPRFWRSSLAIDHELPGGVTATLEGQFTETMTNIAVRNVNLRPPNETTDGPAQRPIWVPSQFEQRGEFGAAGDQRVDSRFSNINVVSNTSEGYSYDVTARFQKTFQNLTESTSLETDFSYTFGDSYSENDGLSSQINSVWEGPENVNGLNDPGVARSDFSIGHRFLVRAGVRQEISENVNSTVSLIYDGQSGRPFSYVIGGSDRMVRERGEPRSLFFVPEDASQLSFAETQINGVTVTPEHQANALDQFISENETLSEKRGQFTARNDDRTPFEGVVDLQTNVELTHDILGRDQSVELTAHVFNFSSLLGDALGTDWGQRFIGFSRVQPTEFQRFKDAENGDFTPVFTAPRVIGSVEDTNGDGVAENVETLEQGELFTERTTGSSFSSQWQVKFGVTYNF